MFLLLTSVFFLDTSGPGYSFFFAYLLCIVAIVLPTMRVPEKNVGPSSEYTLFQEANEGYAKLLVELMEVHLKGRTTQAGPLRWGACETTKSKFLLRGFAFSDKRAPIPSVS